MIIIKSEDQMVKNFGIVAFDESGVKDISFLPIEDFDDFVQKNQDATLKTMKKSETQIKFFVPYGIFKDEPLTFVIRGNENKFLIQI